MRKIYPSCLSILLLWAACIRVACGQELLPSVPAGTTLAIRLEHSIKAHQARPGDEVRSTLVAPVLAHGSVAIPANAKVLGAVVAAEPLSPGRSARLMLRFDRAEWRSGAVALNAYITRQLVVRRTFEYESRSFCPPVERLPPQQAQGSQQQPGTQQQKPTPAPPPPPPPPAPPVRPQPRPYDDLCHSPYGVRHDDPRRLTFSSPAIKDVALNRLAGGVTELTSVKRNIVLKSGMILELRQAAP